MASGYIMITRGKQVKFHYVNIIIDGNQQWGELVRIINELVQD